MATLVLGGAGYFVGMALGGPAGAYIGGQIGAYIGANIDLQNSLPHQDIGKLSDLRYSGSSYGAAIPRLWGIDRLGGNIIWVAEDANGNHLVDHTRRVGGGGKGGGSGSKSKTHWYSATIAVAFCAGSIFCPDPTDADGGSFVSRSPVLKQLWADDVLVYDADASSNIVVPTWHSGSEIQEPDSVVVAKLGVASGSAPAWPGLAYAVIEDMSLEDFGNRVPNFSAIIETSTVTVGDVFSDLCRSAGVLSSQIDATAGTDVVTGFQAAARGGVQGAIEALLLAYGFDCVEVDNVLRLVRRGGSSVVTIDVPDLGATTGSEVPRVVRKRSTPIELPGRVEVTFSDTGNQFQNGVQSVVRVDADIQNSRSISLPMSFSGDQGRVIAGRELDRIWTECEGFSVSLPPKYLKIAPGDVFTIPVDDTATRVRAVNVGLAPIGEMKIDAVLDDPDVLTQPASSGGGGRDGEVNLTPIPSEWVAWSGTELRDADMTSAGFYVAASGPAGWTGCTVYYSLDGGTTWIDGPVITGRTAFGQSTSTLSTFGGTGFDDTNTVDVEITAPGGVGLQTVADSSIDAGNNYAVLGGEIIAFGVADLTGVSAYTLSHLKRKVRSSDDAGHDTGDLFVPVSVDLARIGVTDAYVGEEVLVKCVSRYQTVSDVTDTVSVTIAERTLTPQEQILATVVRPRFITPVVIGSGVDGDEDVDWTTVDLTDDIPETAQAIMLQVEYDLHQSGESLTIETRPNALGSALAAVVIPPIGTSDDAAASLIEVLRPLDSGSSYRAIDYRRIGSGGTWTLRAIGYWG